jgi:hypothetical protein
MDVEALLQGVIRFSNFMTSRLIVSGVVFYIASGFTDIGSSSEGFLPDIELVNQVVQNYQTIFDVLGVSDFALLLILFMFLTTIHIIYVVFERIGQYLPPAILPLPGWSAIDDVTLEAFDVLREARGEEHTDEENQRLYEFKKKLGDIEQANEDAYAAELAGTNAAFRISKAFILFSAGAWLYAMIFGGFSGDMNILLVILGLSILTALYTAFSLFRANHSRITDLREDVIVQFIGFARIWLSEDYQQRIATACTPSRELRPARFAVVVPVYGTLDVLVEDLRRWRKRKLLMGKV